MEARIARLESDVGHIRSDLVDVKQDVRELRARVDKGFDEARDRLDAMNEKLASAKVWALILFIAQAGAVYGTLARAMGWI
ncbi:MAG TPA: hypothetical protein VKA43_15505 [Gammaproteobacteria bacterium]|nr:hypothetical protein [Gammaproteobacteria bacterium]